MCALHKLSTMLYNIYVSYKDHCVKGKGDSDIIKNVSKVTTHSFNFPSCIHMYSKKKKESLLSFRKLVMRYYMRLIIELLLAKSGYSCRKLHEI